jgi:hypothetical protein
MTNLESIKKFKQKLLQEYSKNFNIFKKINMNLISVDEPIIKTITPLHI